jgi:hypothetical protein
MISSFSDADLHQVEHEVLEAVRRGRVTCLAEVGCKDEVLGANLLCYRGGFLDFHLLILRRIAANIAKLPELLRKP